MNAFRFLLLLTVAGLLCGCGSSLNVKTDYDPEFDFSGYQTYQWLSRTPAPQDDPRVYDDITTRRVRTAVDNALLEKGFRAITSGDPDFKVGWHGSIDTKMNAETVNSHYDHGGMDYRWYSAHDPSAPQSTTYINEWEEGTLIIDIIDFKKGELVWRGQGSALIEEEKSPDREQSDFNAALKTIMAGFPPGP